MTTAIARAIEVAGGPSKVALALGVSAQAVCFWRDGKRRMPADMAARLEAAAEGVVRRWDMRPEDWYLIWPELVGTEGAPPVPMQFGLTLGVTDGSKLIDELGGTGAVARLCRVHSQAVSQWRRNGIPPARLQTLQLMRPDLFGAAAATVPSIRPKACHAA